jgi:hypothetical protein
VQPPPKPPRAPRVPKPLPPPREPSARLKQAAEKKAAIAAAAEANSDSGGDDDLDSQDELPAEDSAFAKAWEEFEYAHIIAPGELPRNFKEAMESPIACFVDPNGNHTVRIHDIHILRIEKAHSIILQGLHHYPRPLLHLKACRRLTSISLLNQIGEIFELTAATVLIRICYAGHP